jgi:hypothetical protein
VHLPARRCRTDENIEPETEGPVQFRTAGMAPATACTGVEYLCARPTATSSRASAHTTNAWVRCGTSDELGQLRFAEQDDNAFHKPRTQTAHAAPCRELNALLAEDSACPQPASWFSGIGDNPRSDGGATVAPPSRANGKTRERAALMVTTNGQKPRSHGAATVAAPCKRTA